MVVENLFDIFYRNNVILYNMFFNYLDNESLYNLMISHKDMQKNKPFMKNLIISRCAHYLNELNSFEYVRFKFQKYDNIVLKEEFHGYEYMVQLILDFTYCKKNNVFKGIIHSKELIELINKLRKSRS